ncbi:MAG: IPT/TIG domain-containing protein [Bacteroidetes bacterium]|nr:IPT/TIG domain-containing protein [Bacteroidota bacterium]
MPNLNPGIQPSHGKGRSFFFLLISVFIPFLLHAQPVITSFSPMSGPIGTTVTISGSNFNATPSSNIVYFGAVQTTVTAATSTSLTVTVPPMTTYEPISVTTGGRTAFSRLPFNITYNDPGQFTPEAFGTAASLMTSGNPIVICSKDLDGDGKTDIVAANSTQLSVYKNNGTPGFPHLDLIAPILSATDYPVAVAVEDFDGDGKPDVVASLQYTPAIYVMRNTSTPGNISFTAPISVTAAVGVVDFAIADFNGDGKPDIAALSNQEYVVSIYANASTTGNLSFPTKDDQALPSGTYAFKILAADFDADGKTDLACADYGTYGIDILPNTSVTNGAISFAPAVVFTTGDMDVDGNYPGTTGVAAADMDGDGLIDLVASNQNFNNLALLRNTSTVGTINFDRSTTFPATVNTAANLVINDLDGDGLPDVCVAGQFESKVVVHRNTSIPGYIELTAGVEYATGPAAAWVIATDLDGDGLSDLAVSNGGTNAVSILINKKADDLAVTSFTPTSGPLGTEVLITGTNFTGATDVKFGGTSASSFVVESATSIRAIVAGGSSGAVTVIKSNGFAYKDGFNFQVAGPAITSFSPTSASTGQTVTIEGTAFNSVTAVTFGGTPASSFSIISDTKINAIVGTGSSGEVRVTNTTDFAFAPGFTYTTTNNPPPPPPPAPQISYFSPASGSTNTDITITGTDLTDITAVSFGGTPALSFRSVSSTILVATVAAGSTGDLIVTAVNGRDTLAGFTYIPPPPPPPIPEITTFSPQSGTTGAKIIIQGQHLSNISSVSFGGSPALAFTIISDNQIQATIGVGATGQLKVTNSSGADSLPGFTYIKNTTDTTTSSTPVFQLVQFSGSISSGQPHLAWQARNDAGIAHYVVERGIDGKQFNMIGTVTVTNRVGNSHNYSLTDPSPRNGPNYYRLKIVDTAGHFTYSSAIAFQITGGTSPVLSVYPNPVKYGFFLVDMPANSDASEFMLADMNGRVFKRQAVEKNASQVRIDIPGLPRGTYQLRWTDGKRIVYNTILVL